MDISHFIQNFKLNSKNYLNFCSKVCVSFWDINVLTNSLKHLYHLLIRSIPIVSAVIAAAAAMLTVQAQSSLKILGGGPMIGSIVGFGGIREVFPLLTAATIAASIGTEYASLFAQMKLSDELNALKVFGLSPIKELIAPRTIACMIGTPIAIICADIVGLLTTQFIGVYQMHVDQGSMWFHLTKSVFPEDIYYGVFKGFILGFFIATISCYFGYSTEKESSNIGKATQSAVVVSMMVISLMSFIFSALFYGQQL